MVTHHHISVRAPVPSPIRSPERTGRSFRKSPRSSSSGKEKKRKGLFQTLAAEDPALSPKEAANFPGLPATPGSPSQPGFEDEVDDLLRWTEGLKASPDEGWALDST